MCNNCHSIIRVILIYLSIGMAKVHTKKYQTLDVYFGRGGGDGLTEVIQITKLQRQRYHKKVAVQTEIFQ